MQMNIPTNLLADIRASLPEELVQTILERPNVRIERIVSHGQVTPPGFWYDQTRSEFVVLLGGAARLEFENETVEMKPGSYIDIPAHRRHRVEWTSPDEPTIWLAIHYG
jgi:cupin 2 domain-containing protein